MIEYNKAITYYVMGTKIELFANETSHGWFTIAEVDNCYYYLSDQLVNLHTAINVWQMLNNRALTSEEFDLVIIENGIKSQAV